MLKRDAHRPGPEPDPVPDPIPDAAPEPPLPAEEDVPELDDEKHRHSSKPPPR
jgi:hypothetical protein